MYTYKIKNDDMRSIGVCVIHTENIIIVDHRRRVDVKVRILKTGRHAQMVVF